MQIMQGDQCYFTITLKDEEGNAITDEDVLDVQIDFGGIVRYFSHPDERGYAVAYSEGAWLFPCSQEDSFSLIGGCGLQARVMFLDGSVSGVSVGTVHVLPSNTLELISDPT